MKYSSTFFLINSKNKVNIIDKDLILLFGSTKDFLDKINSTYKRVQWNNGNTNCCVISDNGVLDFYLSEDEVID